MGRGCASPTLEGLAIGRFVALVLELREVLPAAALVQSAYSAWQHYLQREDLGWKNRIHGWLQRGSSPVRDRPLPVSYPFYLGSESSSACFIR
ncbi:hypothetical protein NITHO_5080005 [Nitrolancea hollandica Lb]|uniref:Uncharacterized protein n=1 Tax=Nitrolancea hollandica Lb TaxID=1129897 RepID=I4ELF6_9BACT|nr:hypothetical protein NITHO_5080005 [Nitrolancea hollandica Lb]